MFKFGISNDFIRACDKNSEIETLRIYIYESTSWKTGIYYAPNMEKENKGTGETNIREEEIHTCIYAYMNMCFLQSITSSHEYQIFKNPI